MPQVTQGKAGRLAWTLFGATVVLLAASAVIGLAGGETWGATLGFIPTSITFAAVGALIAARTGNRLGWLFLAAGSVSAVTVLLSVYAARPAADRLPGAGWAGWAFTVLLGITGYLFFLTLLLFPDGRPPSPRWWPVLWLAVAGGAAEMATSAVSDVNFSSSFRALTDPVRLVAPLTTAYSLETTGQVLVLLAGAPPWSRGSAEPSRSNGCSSSGSPTPPSWWRRSPSSSRTSPATRCLSSRSSSRSSRRRWASPS